MEHTSNNFPAPSRGGTSARNTSASDRSAFKRAEIEEAISIAKMRRVEREFDGGRTKGGYQLRGRKQYLSGTAIRRTGAQWGAPFIYKPRAVYRGFDGRRSFHFGFVGIPKTSRSRSLPKGTKIHPGAAEAASRYHAEHDRAGYLMGDRVQCMPSGEPDFDSNISDSSLDEVFVFFALVEKHERNASPDQATIDFGRDRPLWRRIVDDPECDPRVIDAFGKTPDGRATKVILRGEASALKKVMLRHGFKKARKDEEDLPEEVLSKDARLDDVKWKVGRGGRTQHRLTIALPHEFDAKQRRRALRAVCAELDRLGVMYFGVIHEPTATNDDRNYHIHLDIYDRPCRRMTGTDADLEGRPAKHHKLVPGEVAARQFAARKGEWDFTVEREYVSGSRNDRKHYPFRANKVREVNHRDFPAKLRRIVEDEVNSIAAGAGMKPLYDARTYKKMGIDKEPDEALGSREHALVMRGIPTDKSLRNEQRHSDAQHRRFDHNFHLRMMEIEQYEHRLELISQTSSDIPKDPRDEKEAAEARAEVERLRRAAEAKRELDLLSLAVDRICSSEAAVSDRAIRVIEAGGDRSGDYAERLADGRRWFTETQCGDDNLAQITHDLAAACCDGHATERALEARLQNLVQSVDKRASVAPDVQSSRVDDVAVGQSQPSPANDSAAGNRPEVLSSSADTTSDTKAIAPPELAALRAEQLSSDQQLDSDMDTGRTLRATSGQVKPVDEGRAATFEYQDAISETRASAAAPPAGHSVTDGPHSQSGERTTSPVLIDGKGEPVSETEAPISQANEIADPSEGGAYKTNLPGTAEADKLAGAAQPAPFDRTATGLSASQVPVREMFGYIFAHGWRLDCEGPRQDGDIVFAEPRKVPPSFQRWLAKHQNFAPWFYSTQQHLLNPSVERAEAQIKAISSRENVAPAHREAAMDAARRGGGIG